MSAKPKKARRWKMTVPIFDADVHLLVCADPVKEWGPYKKLFGVEVPEGGCEGFSASDGNGSFIVHLRSDKVTATVLGHEIFHLTRQILEWCGVKDPDNHETGAHLCGFLMSWATKCLNNL